MTHRRSPLALVLGILCLVGPLQPAGAHAGTYYVYACHGDGINAAFTPSHSAGATAFAQCPGGVNGNTGLTVRNVYKSDPAGGFSHARLSSTAPAGTYIDGISFVGQVYSNSNWRSGLFNPDANTWIWCGPGCGTLPFWTSFSVSGFATRTIELFTICGADRCNANGMQGGLMFKDVTLRVQDVTQPSVSGVSGPLVSGGWLRGAQTVDVAGSDNAGVRALRVLVDGHPRKEAQTPCDLHHVAPCPRSTRPPPRSSSSA